MIKKNNTIKTENSIKSYDESKIFNTNKTNLECLISKRNNNFFESENKIENLFFFNTQYNNFDKEEIFNLDGNINYISRYKEDDRTICNNIFDIY